MEEGSSSIAVTLEELFQNVTMFARMQPSARALIAEAATRIEVPAGHTLCVEGEKGDTFYIIESGTANCYIQREATPRPMPRANPGHLVSQLNAGDYFGELALDADLCKRTATVVTTSPAALFCIDRENYDATLREHFEARHAVSPLGAHMSTTRGHSHTSCPRRCCDTRVF